MLDVICFGSATSDIFIETGLKEERRKIAYPVGHKIPIKKLEIESGGGGVNVAVGLARMGLKTAFLGKLGKDTSGDSVIKGLKKERVKFIGKRIEGESGYGFILDSYEKNRTILTYHGVSDSFKFEEINKRKLKSRYIFFTTLRGKAIKTQENVLNYCRKKGTKIIFNLDPKSARKSGVNLKNLVKKIDIIIMNKEESQELVKGKTLRQLAKNIYDLGSEVIVITDKNKPVCAYDGKEYYSIKPHNIKVVERTGAGDAFTSGFLAGYIRTKNIGLALRVALANSESVIRYFGAHNKLLRWNEL